MVSVQLRQTLTPWFNCPNIDPHARMRLFCFPYAGGGASIYRGWQHSLPAGVEVWPAQLPGRGGRFKQPALATMDELVTAAAEAIKPFLDLPISLFGHSVGAMAAFELAHLLPEEFGVNVSHLFVSGARGPRLPRTAPRLHDLPEDEFLTELKALNGTPPEILENPELMRMVSATLRADFSIAESYRYTSRPPLNCPVTVFGGLEDTLASREDLETWRSETTNSFDLWQLPGDHFFIHTSDSLVLQIISAKLRG